jgi:hypothetical protein
VDDAPRANPPLGYRELAWWPEIADGNEGKELVIAFVTNPNGTTTAVLETEEDAAKLGHDPILKGIRVNPTFAPKNKPVEEILIQLPGETAPRPAKIDGLICDAVFSTHSAMRKFVLLYYDTHHILDEEGRTKLNAAIADQNVPAIGHVYPSVSAGVGTDSGFRILQTKFAGTKFTGADWVTLEDYTPPSNPKKAER